VVGKPEGRDHLENMVTDRKLEEIGYEGLNSIVISGEESLVDFVYSVR
jgi:hypothetical protein